MQSTVQQVKQAIRELPLPQRAVAIALKHVFDQIKLINKQEQQEIDANHLQFIQKFKVLQKKASDIIQGKTLLTEKDLDLSETFFNPEEQQAKQKQLKHKNPIPDFWFRAIKNSEYGLDLTPQEQAIFKAVTDLQTNVTTNEIELIVTVEKNDVISEGVFHRRLVLDNGMAVSFEGDEPKWKKSKEDGVLTNFIFSNSKDSGQISIAFGIVGNLVNEIVPYGLEYFLGAVDNEDDEGEEIEDEEEMQEDESQSKGQQVQ